MKKYLFMLFITIIMMVNGASVRLCANCITGNNQDVTQKCCFETKNHLWNIEHNRYSNLCFVSVESESEFENCCEKNCFLKKKNKEL